jgi:hypothetical protein
MFWGKSRKYWSTAIFLAATFLLQGCSAGAENVVPEPTDTPVGENALKYSPSLAAVFGDPWPTNVTRQELVDTVLFKSFEFFDKAPDDACSVKTGLYIDADTLPGHFEIIKSLSSKVTNVFCDHLSSDMTLVAGDYNFLKATVKAEGLPADEFDGICGYELSPSNYTSTGCASKGVAWVGVPFGTERQGKLISDHHAVSMVSHELFHLVQDSIDPGQAGLNQPSGQNLFRPVWWIEGGGEFLGRLMPRYLELQDYGTPPLPTDSYGSAPPLEPFSDLSAFENWDTGAVGANGHYYAGQIALEYIVANAGMEAVVDLLVRLGEGDEFKPAFKKVLGISVDDFYTKFKLLHDNIISN